MENQVMITEELIPVYEEFVRLNEAQKATEKRIAELKAKIIQFHKDNNVDKIKDKGFYSTLSEGHRETLLKNVIEEKFGPLPPECIKKTTYETIRIGGSLLLG